MSADDNRSREMIVELGHLADMIKEFNDPGISPVIPVINDDITTWERLLDFQDTILPKIYANERQLMVAMRQRVALLCLNKYAATIIKQFLWPSVPYEQRMELLKKRRYGKQLESSSDSSTEEMDTSDDEKIVYESKKRARTD